MKEDKVTSAGLHPGFGGGNLSLRAVRGVPKMLELPFVLPQHESEGHIGTVMVGKVRDEVCGCFSLHGRRRVKLHQYLAGDAKNGVLPLLLNVMSQSSSCFELLGFLTEPLTQFSQNGSLHSQVSHRTHTVIA